MEGSTTGASAWKRALPAWGLPALVALLAWTSIVLRIDPAGSYPDRGEGPGITIDEVFNVQQGVYLVEAARTYHLGLLNPASLREIFSDPAYLPDHPPLGRLWLGVHHHLAWALAPPADPDGPFVTACARTGSATAFALTILLVGGFASLWYGRWAGVMAALALALHPRLYGHAHLASLETVTNLMWIAASLSLAHTWPGPQPPSNRIAAATGGVFGLLLLTKIQAVLLPVPLVLFAFYHWRLRAVRPLVIWGGVGLVVFVLGWPWLWIDPAHAFVDYFRRAGQRAELSVWFLGERATDRTVSRWYTLLHFAATTPMKFFVLGWLGWLSQVPTPFWQRWTPQPELPAAPRTTREPLMALICNFPLLAFSLPGVPVYDCERLFLPALALWMIFVGRGAQQLWWRVQTLWSTLGAQLMQVFMLGMMLSQAAFLYRLTPCYLSYYNVVTNRSLPGAEAHGWELDYWGAAVTRTLLQDVVERTPPGVTIAVTPVLHQFQVEELLRQSPILRRHGVKLVPYDPQKTPTEYVLVFRRQADLPPEWRKFPPPAEAVAEVRRQDVPLAGLYRLPPASP